MREARDDVSGSGLRGWQRVQGQLSRGGGGVRGARRGVDGDARGGGVDVSNWGGGSKVVVGGAGVGDGQVWASLRARTTAEASSGMAG